jgi:hypothetical protein
VRSMHTKATRRRGHRMSGELAVVSMILKTGVGALESVNLARSTAAQVRRHTPNSFRILPRSVRGRVSLLYGFWLARAKVRFYGNKPTKWSRGNYERRRSGSSATRSDVCPLLRVRAFTRSS